jgi:hypothetical protein
MAAEAAAAAAELEDVRSGPAGLWLMPWLEYIALAASVASDEVVPPKLPWVDPE